MDLGADHSLGPVVVADDGSQVAFTVHRHNVDEGTLHVQDIATGALSPLDVIDGVMRGTVFWKASGAGVYDAWRDPVLPAAERVSNLELRYHQLGQDSKMASVIVPRQGHPG